MKNTSHLQTPAVRKKRIAAIRAAYRRKRSEAATTLHEAVPVIAYEGTRHSKPNVDADRQAVASDFIAVVARILGVR